MSDRRYPGRRVRPPGNSSEKKNTARPHEGERAAKGGALETFSSKFSTDFDAVNSDANPHIFVTPSDEDAQIVQKNRRPATLISSQMTAAGGAVGAPADVETTTTGGIGDVSVMLNTEIVKFLVTIPQKNAT